MDAGEVTVLRELWRGRVWAARPARVLEDRRDQRAFYVAARSPWMQAVGGDGRVLRLPEDEWSLGRFATTRPWISFAWPGRSYAVLASWGDVELRSFAGYYVNLQTPLRPAGAGFDYVDHLLDVLIDADRSTWRWKDEDELDEAVARGVFSVGEAETIRAEGLRAVRHVMEGEPPFDRDWSGWRSDPSWSVPDLPPGWDRVEPT